MTVTDPAHDTAAALNFELGEELSLVQDAARDFADGVLAPLATKHDREETISDLTADDAGPGTGAAEAEEAALLRDTIDELSPSQRRILRMRIDRGLSYAEIAKRLSLSSPDAARMRFTRALVSLREAWRS